MKLKKSQITHLLYVFVMLIFSAVFFYVGKKILVDPLIQGKNPAYIQPIENTTNFLFQTEIYQNNSKEMGINNGYVLAKECVIIDYSTMKTKCYDKPVEVKPLSASEIKATENSISYLYLLYIVTPLVLLIGIIFYLYI